MGYFNDLKNQALASLKGKWGSFVGLTFIYILLYGLASGLSQFGTIFQGSSFTTLAAVFTLVGVILTILFIPMQYGYSIAHLNSSRQDLPADIGDLFCGYKRFGRVLGTLLLMSVVIGASVIPAILIMIMLGRGTDPSQTWWLPIPMLLLMIPAFILALAYSMVPFIIHDDEDLHAGEILAKSRMMMKGHKGELFLLLLSFIGWVFLCVLTLFIGYLWLAPYVQMTEVKFYESIRAEYEGVGKDEMPLQEGVAPADETAPVEEVEKPAEVNE